MGMCKITPINKPPKVIETKAIEIKIRFKSGEIGYFKLLENEDINTIYTKLGNAIKDEYVGVLECIDLADDKLTIINLSEIVSFGFSEVTM